MSSGGVWNQADCSGGGMHLPKTFLLTETNGPVQRGILKGGRIKPLLVGDLFLESLNFCLTWDEGGVFIRGVSVRGEILWTWKLQKCPPCVNLFVVLFYRRPPQPVADLQATMFWADRPTEHPVLPPVEQPILLFALLQPNETVFDVQTLFEPLWEAKFRFVALVSSGPSSHSPTGNLLLPTTPDKSYPPTSNENRAGYALWTEHAGFSTLFRIWLIPPLSRASPNSLAVLSLKTVSCCQRGPDSDATWLLLNSGLMEVQNNLDKKTTVLWGGRGSPNFRN